MDSKEIRLILKKMHPNKVREIKNLVWFEDDNQKWVFEYSFIKKLSDESIAYRLGFVDRQTIYKKALRIISLNYEIIEHFLTR